MSGDNQYYSKNLHPSYDRREDSIVAVYEHSEFGTLKNHYKSTQSQKETPYKHRKCGKCETSRSPKCHKPDSEPMKEQFYAIYA